MLESPYVTQYLTEHFAEADYPTLEGYERFGGYTAARKALTEMTPDDVIEVVKTAGLQGRGGAGFPALACGLAGRVRQRGLVRPCPRRWPSCRRRGPQANRGRPDAHRLGRRVRGRHRWRRGVATRPRPPAVPHLPRAGVVAAGVAVWL